MFKPILMNLIAALAFLIEAPRANAQADKASAMLVGLAGTVLIHETGHALTVKALGWNVQSFRPYPSRIPFPQEDGSVVEKWTTGAVIASGNFDSSTPSSEISRQKAWIAAGGSGTTAIAVLVLAPLLPKISGFGATSLNSMLTFSAWDWPAYTIGDAFGLTNGIGDWTQVSAETGVSIYWFVAGSIASGFLLNHYRNYWLSQSDPNAALFRPRDSSPAVTIFQLSI